MAVIVNVFCFNAVTETIELLNAQLKISRIICKCGCTWIVYIVILVNISSILILVLVEILCNFSAFIVDVDVQSFNATFNGSFLNAPSYGRVTNHSSVYTAWATFFQLSKL